MIFYICPSLFLRGIPVRLQHIRGIARSIIILLLLHHISSHSPTQFIVFEELHTFTAGSSELITSSKKFDFGLDFSHLLSDLTPNEADNLSPLRQPTSLSVSSQNLADFLLTYTGSQPIQKVVLFSIPPKKIFLDFDPRLELGHNHMIPVLA